MCYLSKKTTDRTGEHVMSFSSGQKTIRGIWWSIEHPEIFNSLWKTDSLSFAVSLQGRIMMRRQNRRNCKFVAEAQQQQLPTAARRVCLHASPIAFGFCHTPCAAMCHCRARDLGSSSSIGEFSLVPFWLVTPCLLTVENWHADGRLQGWGWSYPGFAIPTGKQTTRAWTQSLELELTQ